MQILRYSNYGFKEQYQSHHLEGINFHLHDFNISLFPPHLKCICQEQHNTLSAFYKKNYLDFEYGIWAFINGFKCNQSLNHLKVKVSGWLADIPDTTIVYDVNLEYKMKITDHNCQLFGFYLPAKELKNLTNIRKLSLDI